MAIECETRAGDRVERGGRRILDALPCGVAAVEGGLSDAAVGVLQQGAALRHRQPLAVTVGIKHVEFQPR